MQGTIDLHFCKGKPNMSVAKEGEEILPKPPANRKCPVRKPWLIEEREK